jgi:hypothetical protein
MLFPPAPDHMFQLRNQTIARFGYDTDGVINYQFNDLGYRSDLEFTQNHNPIVMLGNTITFGLGVTMEQSFAGIISKTLAHPVYNFSWGCYGHTNAEQLVLLKQILTTLTPRYVLFQINNLNRVRIGTHISFDNPESVVIDEFNKFVSQLHQTLQSVPHGLIHWDENSYPVALPDCLIHNRYHVDYSISSNKSTFGPKSHKLIAHAILKRDI